MENKNPISKQPKTFTEKTYMGPGWKHTKKYSKKMEGIIKKIRKIHQQNFERNQLERIKEKKKREHEYEMLSPWDNNKILFDVYHKIINNDFHFKYNTFKDYIIDYGNNDLEEEYVDDYEDTGEQINSFADDYEDNEEKMNTFGDVYDEDDYIEYYSDGYSDSEEEY